MELKDVYSSLPPEVLSVGDRIGLAQNVPNTQIDSFIKNRLPNSIYENELQYTSYLLEGDKREGFKRANRKKRRKGLNAKERKQLFNFSKDSFKYETFAKINGLWHSYIESIMDEIKSQTDQIKLIRADFHGAYFIVCASKNPALVGIKGFVVQETKNTYKIINKENRLLTVPKDGTVFAFEHNEVIMKINGYNVKMSSHHRSKIRVKHRKYINDI